MNHKRNWTEEDEMNYQAILTRLDNMEKQERSMMTFLHYHLGGQHPETHEVRVGAINEKIEENHEEVTKEIKALSKRVTTLEGEQKQDNNRNAAVRGLVYSIAGGGIVGLIMFVLNKVAP